MAERAPTLKAPKGGSDSTDAALKIGAVVRVKFGTYKEHRATVVGRNGKRWRVVMGGGWIIEFSGGWLEVVGFDPFTPGATPPKG